jgi:Ni,Fe-hydrogenase III small subunit
MKFNKIQWTILISGTLFVLAMTYGSGMKSQVKKLQKLTQEYKISQRNLRASELSRHADVVLLHQLEARRLLDKVLEALAKRNFGIAQEQLKAAAAHLTTAKQAAAANTAALDAMIPALSALGETPDPTKLTELVHQMDSALDKVSPKTDYKSEVTVPPPTGNDEVDPAYEFGQRG